MLLHAPTPQATPLSHQRLYVVLKKWAVSFLSGCGQLTAPFDSRPLPPRHYPSNQQVKGVITMCIDVSDIEATRKAVDSVGPVHLLVNNAGVTELQSFLEVTPEAYDKSVCHYKQIHV